VSSPATALPAWFTCSSRTIALTPGLRSSSTRAHSRRDRERPYELTKDRLDLRRIALATALAAGLGVGLAFAFLRHAQATSHVGPTSATLGEAFSSFLGAGIGLALGSALGALSIRRGSPLSAGVIAGLAAYILVLAPVFVITDDVALAEDLNPGGLVFLASCFLRLAFSLSSAQPSEGLSRRLCIEIACRSGTSTSVRARQGAPR
jgi:hypothetical protein